MSYRLEQDGIHWRYTRRFLGITTERRVFTSFDIYFAKLVGDTLIVALHDGSWLELSAPSDELISRTACARGYPTATPGRAR